MKKKLNIEHVTNELRGASAFFPDFVKDNSPTADPKNIPNDTEDRNSLIPEIQNSRKPEIQNSVIPEIQNSGNQDIQKSRIPENQNIAKREFYTKGTYRLCDEALDAIDDAKKILKRRYKLKVNMEEIVETAILETFKDLVDKEEKSALVVKYSRNPENKNS